MYELKLLGEFAEDVTEVAMFKYANMGNGLPRASCQMSSRSKNGSLLIEGGPVSSTIPYTSSLNRQDL